MLKVKEDLKTQKGTVVLKAGVAYQPKGTDIIDGIEYIIYPTAIEGEEFCIPADKY